MNPTEKPLIFLIVVMLVISVCSLFPDGHDYLLPAKAWHFLPLWIACAIIAVTGVTFSLLGMTGKLRIRFTLVVLLTATSCLLLAVVITGLATTHPPHRKLHELHKDINQ
jgi:hypothetical membrane protein